jgi:ribonuclease I
LTSFWQHEWQKHGTCAESVPAYTGEFNYFSQAIALNKRFDLYRSTELHAHSAHPLTPIAVS